MKLLNFRLVGDLVYFRNLSADVCGEVMNGIFHPVANRTGWNLWRREMRNVIESARRELNY